MGRAMEEVFFSHLADNAIQELEVKLEGIEGHIDFGSDPLDYECKLTWSREPETPEELFDSKFWWVQQAGAYTYMRKRTKINFVVCFLNPIPKIRCYQLEWTQEELTELWMWLKDNKEYLEIKEIQGALPMKTPLTWLCRGCAYKEVCDDSF
jgi:CRISPR/Cas system-associated exonuclease Cas4 (RecB family)